MSNQIVRGKDEPARGSAEVQTFTGIERRSEADVSIAAAAARERAAIEAEYIMAERHPRNWHDVRTRMLDHCARPKFAEVSRYAKPVGKKLINGEWVEQHAKGFTVRFTETLGQEMGNVKPWSAVAYEDDLIRIVRIGLTDLQRNVPRSREVTFAKTVERRGYQDKKTKEWNPPEGREVLSQRLNSRGEPTYLVRATEDELRAKVNSEESKTQRDFTIKLVPRDILEECEVAVYATMQKEDKTDPKAGLKRWLDAMHRLGIEPSELEKFFGKKVDAFGPKETAEMRELGQAIKEGQTTFDEALKQRYDQPLDSGARDKVIESKIEELRREGQPVEVKEPANSTPAVGGPPANLEDLEDWPEDESIMRAWVKVKGVVYRFLEEEGHYRVWEQPKPPEKPPEQAKPIFGRKPK